MRHFINIVESVDDDRFGFEFLSEISIGGHIDDDVLSDIEPDHDFDPRQLSMFPDMPAEPTLPEGYRVVGRIGEYFVIQSGKSDSRGSFGEGASYYLFENGNPITLISTQHPDSPTGEFTFAWQSPTNPNLQGTGLRVITAFVKPEYRGKGLAILIYKWLLHNACDYILPDDCHTRDGVNLWQKLIRDPELDVIIYNPHTDDYYKAKPGFVWSNVYKSDKLRPYVTLKGKGFYRTSPR